MRHFRHPFAHALESKGWPGRGATTSRFRLGLVLTAVSYIVPPIFSERVGACCDANSATKPLLMMERLTQNRGKNSERESRKSKAVA
jgi:hypothetical protein